MELCEYTVVSVTEGIEALASTRVSIRPLDRAVGEGFLIHAQVPAPSPTAHTSACASSCMRRWTPVQVCTAACSLDKRSSPVRVVQQGGQTARTFSGSGANEDIVVASVRAYVSALNRLIAYVSANQRAVEAAEPADEPVMATV